MHPLQVAALLLLFATRATATEEALSLEDALGGFDEEIAELPLEADADLEGLLEGFDDEPPVEGEVGGLSDLDLAPSSSWRGHWINALSWNIGHDAPAAAGSDYRGLSKLSTKLWLETEKDLGEGWKFHGDGYLRHDFAYDLNNEPYPQAVIDRYRQDAEIGELWLRGSLNPNLDLKLGRQVVIWGQSDYLRVNDRLNPIDLREPGLGEIETLRRPVTMARADYFHGPWRLTGLLIPENRPNLTAPCGSDFSSVGAISEARCQALAVPELFPEDGLEEMEMGLSAMGRFSGWDLSLYVARLNHDTPYEDLNQNQLRYARINHLGAAINVADGSWLWKGELARLDGLEYANASAGKKVRWDLLLGAEYQGIVDVTLSAETLRRQIGDYESGLSAEPDYQDRVNWQTVVAYQQEFWNQTLHLKGVLMRSGASLDEGGYQRLSLAYDLDDEWSISGGGIWYQSAKYPPDWGKSDRLFAELRYDF